MTISQAATPMTAGIFASLKETRMVDNLTAAQVADTQYKRGQCLALNTNTNKLVAWDQSEPTNGVDVLAGILVDDVDVSGGDQPVHIYNQGDFLLSQLNAVDPIVAGTYPAYAGGTIKIVEEVL